MPKMWLKSCREGMAEMVVMDSLDLRGLLDKTAAVNLMRVEE